MSVEAFSEEHPTALSALADATSKLDALYLASWKLLTALDEDDLEAELIWRRKLAELVLSL